MPAEAGHFGYMFKVTERQIPGDDFFQKTGVFVQKFASPAAPVAHGKKMASMFGFEVAAHVAFFRVNAMGDSQLLKNLQYPVNSDHVDGDGLGDTFFDIVSG